MRADYHVHTDYSDDSDYPMADVVRDAIRLGLEEICFTDHVDYGVKRDVGDPEARIDLPANVDYDRYYREYRQLSEACGSRIRLKLGLEFGMQRHTIGAYERLFSRYPFDFILLSAHQVDDLEIWNGDYERGKTQAEYNLGYYEEILYVMRHYHNYSVLGHLDHINRYDPMGPFPFEPTRPIVTEILKTAIADGKGLEINTSWHRYGLHDVTPCREILKLYHDLGGRIVTIGSDSHAPEHLGAYYDEAAEILKSIGFTQVCTYERMKPIFHEL